MDNVPLTVGVDDFFDSAEDITDISIPLGTEELALPLTASSKWPSGY